MGREFEGPAGRDIPDDRARPFTAVVLAADRTASDQVAAKAGVACKAFAPVGGVPMVLRVVDALQAAGTVGRIVLCGPPAAILDKLPELKRRIDAGELAWCPSLGSPSQSAAAALSAVGPDQPVLLTTADHALLRADIVDYFVRQSRASGADATVALVKHSTVLEKFPSTKRTVLRMRDGHFCTCNLFAFMSPRARKILTLWRGVEQRRKMPRRLIAGLLGIWGVAAYLLGWLSMAGALRRVSMRIGAELSLVLMPIADAGVDVDTPADLELVESLLGGAGVARAGDPQGS